MSKKSDSYYFQNFIECVQCGCEAAKMLEFELAASLRDQIIELRGK